MGYLPGELQAQVISEAVDILPIAEAVRLRLVSRQFSALVIEGLFESDVALYRISEQSVEGNRGKGEFWSNYLAYRVMSKTKPLGVEHQLLRRLAEKVLDWRKRERSRESLHVEDEETAARETEPESDTEHLKTLIHQICEMAVRYGHFGYSHQPCYRRRGWEYFTRRAVYLGTDCDYWSQRCRELPADLDSTTWFNEALMATAAYLNEATLLKNTILQHSQGGTSPGPVKQEMVEREERLALTESGSPMGKGGHQILSYFDKEQSKGARMWLGSSCIVAAERGNVECVAILVKGLMGVAFGQGMTLMDYPSEFLTARIEATYMARIGGSNNLHRDPTDCRPRFCVFNNSDGKSSDNDDEEREADLGHPSKKLRGDALDKLLKILNTTRDLETFNMLYPFRVRALSSWEWSEWSEEGLARWGSRRLERAARDGACPIVKKLVRLKYKLGNQPLVDPIEQGHRDVVDYLLEIGVSLDGGLAAAVRRGDSQVANILLKRGAGNNRESMGNAIRETMFRGNAEMLMLLVKTGKGKGVLNKKAKVGLQKELQSRSSRQELQDGKLDKMLGLMKLL